MKTILEVKKLHEPPFVLHEEIATGTVNGKKIRVICTLNKATLFVNIDKEDFQVNITDIVKAIVERE